VQAGIITLQTTQHGQQLLTLTASRRTHSRVWNLGGLTKKTIIYILFWNGRLPWPRLSALAQHTQVRWLAMCQCIFIYFGTDYTWWSPHNSGHSRTVALNSFHVCFLTALVKPFLLNPFKA